MGLTTHPHVELRLSISIVVILKSYCVSHGLLWGDIYKFHAPVFNKTFDVTFIDHYSSKH